MITRERYAKKAFPVDFTGIKSVLPKVSAVVEMENGKPTMIIDEARVEPLFFFGNTEAKNYQPFVAEEIKMAAARGIHLHTVVVHFPIIPEGYDRNFDCVDRILDYVINADSEAKIIIRVPLYPHDVPWWEKDLHGDNMEYEDGASSITWWQKNNPDDLMKFKDGTLSIPSVASDVWMQQVIAALNEGIEYITNHPAYSKHVIGYHPTYGNTGEWFYMYYREKGTDNSECNRRGFARWLKQKYSSLSVLSSAWGRKVADFEQINLPDINYEVSSDNKLFLTKDQCNVVDYYDYINDINELRIEQLSEFVKLKTNRKSLVMIFYGYNMELPEPTSGHGYLQELLECKNVDLLSSPVSYQDRSEGGIMAYMAPVDSIQQHGVLWMVEDDTRTHRALKSDGDDGDFNPTIAESWVTRELHRRNMASIVTHSNGMWWMDLWGTGWLMEDQIWENNRKLYDIYKEYAVISDQPFTPDVAVIVNEKIAFQMNNPKKHQTDLIYKSNVGVYRSGLSTGFYTWKDAISGNVPSSVKIYVFNNGFDVSEEEVKLIKQNIMKNGNTVLWIYGVDTISGKYTEELCGMKLESFNTDDYNPMFYAQKADCIDVFERFESNREPSFVAKKHNDYITGFCAYPTITAKRLRQIADYSGIHVFIDTDDYFVGGQDIFCVHATSAGKKKIKLPYKAVVTNLLDGTIIETDEFEIDMQLYTTVIYHYKRIES